MSAIPDWLPDVPGPVVVRGLSRRNLAIRLGQLGYRVGAEVGVRQGAFSLRLCQEIPRLNLLCVDPWAPAAKSPAYSHDRNHAVATERLRPFGAMLDRRVSLDAVQDVPLGLLDFAYIDGNHRYDFVRDDLEAWSDRVRAGGIVSGDDYNSPGVKRAVHEFVRAHGISRWWLTDDRRLRRNRKGGVFVSWFWFKP